MKHRVGSSIFGLAAVIVYFWPEAANLLVFDRAAILRGEWWRIFTGHFVHFSSSHLLLDTMVWILAGGIVEAENRRVFLRLLTITLVNASVALLIFVPQLRFYGGLSGVATAMLFWLALAWRDRAGALRVCALLVIAAVLLKLMLESFTGRALLADVGSASARTVPLVHAIGIVTATFTWLRARRNKRHRLDSAAGYATASLPTECSAREACGSSDR